MVDSDDEYDDRKRRDKFKGERSTAGDNYRDRRDDRRGREDWGDRRSGRPDYYRGGIRDRYSPGRELPPPKRMRPDWNDEGRSRYPPPHDGYGMYGWGHEHYPMHGGMHSFPGGGGAMGGVHHPPMPIHNRQIEQSSDMQTQPPMLTLKQFLDTQDDGISDSEVLQKYSEYKFEFKRQQLNEFFVAHKDEEWFKVKYHPEESAKRKQEQLGFLKKRVDVFFELLEKGLITNVSVDINQSDQLLRLLDTVVIKLEGGTDEDLKALDEPDIRPDFTIKKIIKEQDDDVIITDVKPNVIKDDDKDFCWESVPSKQKSKNNQQKVNDDEENWDTFDSPKVTSNEKHNVDDEDDWGSPKIDDKKKSNEIKKMKNNDEDDWDDDISQNTNQEEPFKPWEVNEKKEEDICEIKDDEEEMKVKSSTNVEEDISSPKKSPSIRKRRTSSESSNASDSSKRDTEPKDENPQQINSEKDDEKMSEKDTNEEITTEKVHSFDKEEELKQIDEKETIDLDKVKDEEYIPVNKFRALHRTSSIFLRNLPPSITKSEIEAMCKKYDGFLRVAIADPLVERRWFRRGWVTFQRDVNIKEICWNLNNIRLRDCEMGAIVNRDLSRRVRPVNGITSHKTVIRSDIKLLTKIALNLDARLNLWNDKYDSEKKSENGEKKQKSFGFKSSNPVLQNITEYLIEEASAEEEELLGLTSENTSNDGESLERDPQLMQVLDKLILYMRVVHSVDYYNHCEYPYEDEMPNRCGIIHARGPPPPNKITKQDIDDYIKNFENKMTAFLTKTAKVDENELKDLGSKDTEAEVEKFVQANTQELSKDKWLCPLSGKKFKGPEFIRKHIFNKHIEKVEEVRREVEYFNNYLKDPKRPQLPEHPGNAKGKQAISSDIGSQMPYRGGYPGPTYAPPYAAYAPPIIAPPRPRGFGGRRELPPEHQRRIIGYHDLDAPQNFDYFDN